MIPPPPKERNPFKVTHRVALEMLVKVRCEQKFRSPSIFLSACTCDCACAVIINFGGRYFPNLYRLGVIAMSYRCYPSRKVPQRQQSTRPISIYGMICSTKPVWYFWEKVLQYHTCTGQCRVLDNYDNMVLYIIQNLVFLISLVYHDVLL